MCARYKVEQNKRKNQVVVVVSRSHATGVGVIRALGFAGYTVDLVASSRTEKQAYFASRSKFVRKYKEVVSPKFRPEGTTDEELLKALLSYEGKEKKKPFLFPTDDYCVSIIDENRSELEKIFLIPQLNRDDISLTEAMDKHLQNQFAMEAEIRVPMEWLVELKAMSFEIPEDIVYPCFVKPLESVNGYKNEMRVCKNRAELAAHLTKLSTRGIKRSVLVQEYLKIDYEIDLSGVALDQEIFIPAVIKKTAVAKHEKGVTLSGMVVPIDQLGDVKEKLTGFLQKFRYVGMFDMEFNVVGGQLYFNEINFRSGGPNYSYYLSGANLPKLLVDYVTNGCYEESDASVDRFGINFIYEKVAWEDYFAGFYSLSQINRMLSDADFGLLNCPQDPGPYKFKYAEFKKRVNKLRFEERKRKIKKSKIFILFRAKKKLFIEKVEGLPQLAKKNKRKRYNVRPRVLVVGRNYCTNLCVARSVGMAGYDVEVMRVYQTPPSTDKILTTMHPDMYSKYIKAYYTVITNRTDETLKKALILRADKRHKMLVIPADDLSASVIDKYYNSLKKYYILPNVNNKQGEINRLMTKHVQKRLAKEAGLPVVNSVVIRGTRGEFYLPEGIKYPCFIKPDVSRNAAKSRMHRCENEEELKSWLTVFSERRDISMLVEDYVEIKKEYSILGVSTREGVISSCAFGAEIGGEKEHRGVALVGKVIDASYFGDLTNKINAFIASLGYEGLFDVDLIETTDGTVYFVELNMRIGASGYSFNDGGVNLPGIFADYMVYKKALPLNCKPSNIGRSFVSEKVLLDECYSERIRWVDFKKLQKNSDIHFIKCKDDNKAYRHYKKFIKYARRKNKPELEDNINDLPLEDRISRVEERALKSVVMKTLWTEEYALKEMENIKERYGISFVRYDVENLWRFDETEISRYLDERKNDALQRERHIESVVSKSGKEYEKVFSNMKDSENKLGVSFEIYDLLNLWRVPSKEKKKYLTCIVDKGCTEQEYYAYNMAKMSLRNIDKLFLRKDANKIAADCHVNDELIQLANNKKLFYKTFRPYIRRNWMDSANMTFEDFSEAFELGTRIVYSPLDSLNGAPVVVEINKDNIEAVFESLKTLPEGIVEKCLEQNSQLTAVSSKAMAKLRFVTLSKSDNDEENGNNYGIIYSTLLIGRAEGQMNQFYEGNFYASVDIDTGIIITDGISINGRKTTKDPVSRTEIKGFSIPLFSNAKDTIEKIISKYNIQGFIGWDFVVCEDKVALVGLEPLPTSAFFGSLFVNEKRV